MKDNCVWKIKIDGKEKVFNSDLELDTFLKNNSSNYIVNKSDLTFSTDAQSSTLAKLDEAKVAFSDSALQVERINDDGDVEYYTKVPYSISTTKMITEYGKPDDWSKPVVTPFDLNNWKINQLDKLIKDGLSKEEAKLLISDTILSWRELTDFGNDVHAVAESVFEGKEIGKTKLTDQQISKLKNDFERFQSMLKDQYGNDIKIFSEFSIKSKDLDPSFKALLNNIDSINGRLDLLVVDSNGRVHIYDFKVSRKAVGEWDETNNRIIAQNKTWHSTKKLSAAYQLTFYKRIFEQYGLNVATVNIVPIELDIEYKDDNVNIDKLNDIIFDTSKIVTNMKGTNPGGKIYDNVAALLPIVPNKTENVDLIDGMYNDFNKVFPDQTQSRVVKQFEASVDYYKNQKRNFWRKLNTNDEKYAEGYRYIFWKTDTDKKPVYTKTEEDLDKALVEYVNTIDEKKGSELLSLASNIQLAIEGNIERDNIISEANNAKRSFINAHFGKFIDNDWNFVQNDDLNQAGIFMFQKNGQTDIVIISNKALHNLNNLGLGTSLLGRFKKDDNVDLMRILKASNGNLEIMKMLFFIQNNPKMFENSRINTIKAVNIWHGTYVENRNSQIIDNFKRLLFQQKLDYNLNENLFNDDVTALVNLCDGYIREGSRLKVVDFQVSTEASSHIYNKQFILDKIAEVKRRNPNLYNNENYSKSDPDWIAYDYLNRALLAIDNYGTYFELDPGQWIDGFRPVGLNTSSIQYSPSVNARQVGDIINSYTNDVRAFYDKYAAKFDKPLRDYYKAMGAKHALGGEARLFLNWFNTDPNDPKKLDPSFTLKRPNDPSLTKEESKALDLVLRIMNELKLGTSDPEILESAKIDGSYYELPLLEAKFNRQVKQLGVTQTIKNKWKEHSNLVSDVFVDQIQTKQAYERESTKLYNRFNISEYERQQLINQYGVGFFETDVERVLREILTQYGKERVSENYIPQLQGIKLALKLQQALGGSEITNVNEFIDKYLKKSLYGESIVEKGLQPAQKFLNVFKAATSKLTLGFNARSGMREVFQGAYVGFSRAFAGTYGDQFDLKSYTNAFFYVGSEVRNSINDVHKLEWLNTQYGMANSGISELADGRRINQLGIMNWGSDQTFFFSKAPDFLHRMSFLVAKMMHQGSWEAHSLVDGALVYDFSKDARYSEYVNDNKNSSKYAEQRALYLTNLEQFNREGYNLQEGDALPRAYTTLEASGLKNFADLCYGHYDGETRALMNSMFLGSFFMQFKTFVTAKLEQWTIKPGIYNNLAPKQQYDINGEKLYKVMVYPNENHTGIPTIKIVTESEIGNYDPQVVQPYVEFEGNPVEGIAYSVWSYIKAIGKLDQKGLNELWKDPLKRGNLFLFLHDMIWMMLLAGLIQWAFDFDTLKEDKSWFKNWSAMVLYGSTQDGPIHLIVESMVSDLNPPTKTNIEKVLNTTGQVFTGDISLYNATVSNIGALRELKTVQRLF